MLGDPEGRMPGGSGRAHAGWIRIAESRRHPAGKPILPTSPSRRHPAGKSKHVSSSCFGCGHDSRMGMPIGIGTAMPVAMGAGEVNFAFHLYGPSAPEAWHVYMSLIMHGFTIIFDSVYLGFCRFAQQAFKQHLGGTKCQF